MGKATRISRIVVTRGSFAFAAKILLSLITVVFAASIAVTSTTYQTEVGSYVNVPNAIIVTSTSYYKASSNSTSSSCTSPIIPVFGLSTPTANTNITSGDWVFEIRVNSTASTPLSHPYNVTLVLASSTYGPACTQSAASLNTNFFIDCKFDVGATIVSSPYTFKITSTG